MADKRTKAMLLQEIEDLKGRHHTVLSQLQAENREIGSLNWRLQTEVDGLKRKPQEDRDELAIASSVIHSVRQAVEVYGAVAYAGLFETSMTHDDVTATPEDTQETRLLKLIHAKCCVPWTG
jgi:hypothetical protein